MRFQFKNGWLVFVILVLVLSACSSKSTQAPAAETPAPGNQASAATQASTLALANETAAPALAVTPPVAADTLAASTPAALTPEAALTTEPAPLTSLVGIHLGNLNSAQQVDLFKESGATWVRFDNFHWDKIEPERADPAVYHWEAVDEAGLLNAAQAGMSIIGMILLTPEWAQKYPGVACGPVAQAEFGRFAQFVGAAVARYSAPPYHVKVWEIGNEPDILHGIVDPNSGYGCWGEPDDTYLGGGYYGEMLKTVYPAVKAADPQSQVLVGGLLLDCDPVNPPETSPGSGKKKDCTSSRFLEGILKDGAGNSFDGVSFHAYEYYGGKPGVFGNGNWNSGWNTSGPVLVAKSRFIKDLLASNGATGKTLFNTEVAILCLPEDSPACAKDDFVKTKAYYAAESNAAALAEGLTANVWYHLEGWRGSNLVDASLQPNLAFQAESFSAHELRGAVFVKEITEFQGVKGIEFTRQGSQVWILWSIDGAAHPLALPSAPAAVYDFSGQTLPSGTDMTVDLAPVYVEFGSTP